MGNENLPPNPEEEHQVEVERVLEEHRLDPDEVAKESNIPEKGSALHSEEDEYSYKLETIEKTRQLIARMPEGTPGREAMERALEQMELDIKGLKGETSSSTLPEQSEDS